MATEKLKVFANTANTVSTTAITNVAIKTTSSSEQAVLKTISYEATDPSYPVTASLTNGNASLTTPKTTAATVKNTDKLSGSQIVDVSSTVNLTFDTGADINTVGYADARMFENGSVTIKKLNDTTSTVRGNTTLTFADTVGDFAYSNSGAVQSTNAYSAFGYIDGSGNKIYARHYNWDTYLYTAAGVRITSPVTSYGFSGATYAVATDGTYFMCKGESNDLNLQRRKISDGSNHDMTLTRASGNFEGPTGNQGGFGLYHDGFFYSYRDGPSSMVYKINVSTGVVTDVPMTALGAYCSGAIVTQAANGKYYIIACGGYNADSTRVIDLSDDSITSITHGTLNVSTEYGNMGLEVAPGIGIFMYGPSFIWIDANTMTGAPVKLSLSSYGLPTPASGISSIANIPLHQIPGGTKARAVTHKVYADGVLIEGVA